ncbi:MAG: alkaline phosphatase family protein [Bacteroidaceae bacterium]|nr:alkaline phosphatase family protein [Bacteroidaceae bacterium]
MIKHDKHRKKCTQRQQRTLLLSFLLAVSALASAEVQATRSQVPRVVVNVMIDQLRSDFLEAFLPLYGDDGFKKIMGEGQVFSQAAYPHHHPDLASSAATIASGAAPSEHGIVGRRWVDRQSLRPIFCCDDINYPGVGTHEPSSPQRMAVTTLADELKIATEGKALVYAISPFREVAVFSAGHAANGAVWLDDNTGLWVSSTFYEKLPEWVDEYNQYHNTVVKAKNTVWKPINHLVGNFNYFLSGGVKEPFEHKFKGDALYADFKTSGLINEEVADMAISYIDKTAVGRDEITDYLAVNFYAGNYLHQDPNAAPIEFQDIYVRLDKALAALIKTVEEKVGKQNALFVLTSSGQSDEREEDLTAYRVPTGVFDVKRAASMLNIYLSALYEPANYIEATLGTQLYLNHKVIEEQQISFTELLDHSQDLLARFSGVKDVYTASRLQHGGWTPEISRIRSGYHRKHSGDIVIEVMSGWRYVNDDTKETKLIRASYIPFPIVFYGGNIVAQKVDTPVTVDFIAPTLSKVMRIRAPNACSLPPLKLEGY